MRFYRQIGRGTYFVGHRYQKGSGFGNLVKSAILPFLKYIGLKGIKTAVAIGREAVTNPEFKLGSIVKRNLAEAGSEMLTDAAGRMTQYAQKGRGLKRKRSTSIKRSVMKVKTRSKKTKRPRKKSIKRLQRRNKQKKKKLSKKLKFLKL